MSKKLLAVLVVSVAAVALAGDPELKPAQEEAKAQFEEAIAESVKSLNERCGTKVTVKTDFHNFKEADWSGKAFYSWCNPVIDTFSSLCNDRPAYKKAIAKKLTGISCLFGGVKAPTKKDDYNEVTLINSSFDKGVFTFHMSPDASNVQTNVQSVIEKALNK